MPVSLLAGPGPVRWPSELPPARDAAEVWGAARELAGAPAERPAEDAGAAPAAAELTAAELAGS